ncbi:MAG TPA: isocitrate lyase/phosphoenolpyruvate mutase family protein [Streptosporangiaceae bacterium]|jgi:2-methylisocitrate lyase-like PEP mutase family enzyme|nr:isocitrate lyase/phosphoenolpyruvate mutase family protein [Streptosporangiaceae bacterium]
MTAAGQAVAASQQFAALHRRGEPFLLPNAWDVASAVLLANAGFPAVGTTSLGVTAAAGLIDGAGQGRAAVLDLARRIVPRLIVPVTVDVEGGYSDDPGEVAALACELASVGTAGINLEDARPGGTLRSAAAQARIIRAVTDVAPGLFVNARTDTFWLGIGPEPGRLTDTIGRLLAYADAGASGVFVPGLADLQAVDTITARIPQPLNLLWQPGASLAELGQAGVARVSTGSAPYRRALAAGLATAVAARDGSPPPAGDITYAELVAVLDGSGAA